MSECECRPIGPMCKNCRIKFIEKLKMTNDTKTCENCIQLLKNETSLIENIIELEKEITELKAKLKSAHLANHSLQVKVNTLDGFSITTKTDQEIFLEFAKNTGHEYEAIQEVNIKSTEIINTKISIEINKNRWAIARFDSFGKLMWFSDCDGMGEK